MQHIMSHAPTMPTGLQRAAQPPALDVVVLVDRRVPLLLVLGVDRQRGGRDVHYAF